MRSGYYCRSMPSSMSLSLLRSPKNLSPTMSFKVTAPLNDLNQAPRPGSLNPKQSSAASSTVIPIKISSRSEFPSFFSNAPF